MNEEVVNSITGGDDAATTTETEVKVKKTRKSSGPRKPQTPRLKDWVRVIKSNGNDLPNVTVHARVYASGYCELITNAPAAEGSDTLEGERKQVFKVTSFDYVEDATVIPESLIEKPTETAVADETPAPEAAQ